LSRLVTFRDLCLPAIKGQTYNNLIHRVFISSDLPIQAKEILKDLCKSSLKTSIIEVRNSDLAGLLRHCKSGIEGKVKFIANLDDDDFLAPWYFEEMVDSYLKNEKEKTCDTFYTCPNGLQLTWNELDSMIKTYTVTLENLSNLFESFPKLNIIDKASLRHFPLNNMGLAIASLNCASTLQMGNHCWFDRLGKVYEFGNNKVGWIRTISNTCDHNYKDKQDMHEKKSTKRIKTEEANLLEIMYQLKDINTSRVLPVPMHFQGPAPVGLGVASRPVASMA
jgi:hypothetical protein